MGEGCAEVKKRVVGGSGTSEHFNIINKMKRLFDI